MPLTKSTGNMYPWVTHMHTHLRGKCPHGCSYCYARLPVRGHAPLQQGPLRFEGRELGVRYGEGKTIFMEHKNDLFAQGVPVECIVRVLHHCLAYPNNTYVFQTKNPLRMLHYVPVMPPDVILGCTIESDAFIQPAIGNTLRPGYRADAMANIADMGKLTFVSIEPVMKFDLASFMLLLQMAAPKWISIGADSKGFHLPEPTEQEIVALVAFLKQQQVEVRLKSNLRRLAPSLFPKSAPSA